MPDFFIPTTSVLVPFNCMSSQLQRSKREQRQHESGDPEPRDDFLLAHHERLKMMVHRRHFEDTLAGAQLETADLQEHRNRLEDENAADEKQQHFLFDE